MPLGTYDVADLDEIPSPAVLVFRAYLEQNLDETIRLAGGPERLRPHCKTHKTREIIRLWLERGVRRHKCATPREVEMCLEAGARDVMLAYQLVGPAVDSFAALAARWPDATLAALVDTPDAAAALSRAAAKRGVTIGAAVDLDTGLHRTGVAPAAAAPLYRQLGALPGLRPAGLHVYDAQNSRHQDPAARRQAVAQTLDAVLTLADQLRREGCAVPEIVGGGSGTFPFFAALSPEVIGSPGTTVFWDYGYSNHFPDLDGGFTPAALVLGRVVSRPASRYVTLDIGNKAIAADPPAGKRGLALGLERAETLLHNEEHWTLLHDRADDYRVGDAVFVVPAHICPCTNLHPVLHVIDANGRLAGRWEVAARQRQPLG